LCSFVPEPPESHHVYYGFLRTLDQIDTVDEVLVTIFTNGRSFTGEECVEISCHGSPTICAQICQQLISTGCRTAEPGEFTYRAFINGRLDLVQAESVLTLIESQSQMSAKMALRQLRGELSTQLKVLEDTLIWCLAHLEASIDFSTEDLEVVSVPELTAKLERSETLLREFVASYRSGQILREGLHVALVGHANVGKSSLLNALCGEERAIVTEIAGTTRDVVEGQIVLDGLVVHLSDTAGIRDSADPVERIGIERARRAGGDADLLIHVLDGSSELDIELELESRAPKIFILNKSDLVDEATQASRVFDLEMAAPSALGYFWVSSRHGLGLAALRESVRAFTKPFHHELGPVITQTRHFELLEACHQCVRRARVLASESASPDLITFELQDGLLALQEVLGKRFDDDVLDRIFKEFCIGK
jgi:tRNA modification GTPase